MKKVVFKDSYALIYLHTNIYSNKAINESLKQFKSFATFSISKLGNYNTIKVEPHEIDDKEELTKELLNHILANEVAH